MGNTMYVGKWKVSERMWVSERRIDIPWLQADNKNRDKRGREA